MFNFTNPKVRSWVFRSRLDVDAVSHKWIYWNANFYIWVAAFKAVYYSKMYSKQSFGHTPQGWGMNMEQPATGCYILASPKQPRGYMCDICTISWVKHFHSFHWWSHFYLFEFWLMPRRKDSLGHKVVVPPTVSPFSRPLSLSTMRFSIAHLHSGEFAKLPSSQTCVHCVERAAFVFFPWRSSQRTCGGRRAR